MPKGLTLAGAEPVKVIGMAALTIGMFGDQLPADPADVDRVLRGTAREVSR